MRHMGILTFENSFVVLEICDVGKVALSHTVLICRHKGYLRAKDSTKLGNRAAKNLDLT